LRRVSWCSSSPAPSRIRASRRGRSRASLRSCGRSSGRSPNTGFRPTRSWHSPDRADAIRAIYDANPGRFQVPEEVGVEYIVLSTDALLVSEQVGADEIKSYYESNISKYGEPEQRRASHILIAVKSGAGEAEKAKARERAAQIVSQLRKSPGSFAELAKANSGDSGSAAQGGDLGFFARGMMVRPFEDAASSSSRIRSAIRWSRTSAFTSSRYTGIKAGKMKGPGGSPAEIERELKRQRAGERFAEAAEAFSTWSSSSPIRWDRPRRGSSFPSSALEESPGNSRPCRRSTTPG